MNHRLVGLRFIPGVMSGIAFIWAGTRVGPTSVPVALLMMAVGVITLVLVVRMMLGNRAAAERLESTGALTEPHFDYLIWSALLVPMLLVVVLAVLAITGALTSR